MRIGYRGVRTLAILYAGVPILIFYIGWLNLASAALFVALTLVAVGFYLKNSARDGGKVASIALGKRHVAALAVVALVWCLLAGQGSFVHQSSDHILRNAILRDLIREDWPVLYDGGNSMLCYYIAHWMLPAVAGKLVLLLSGSVAAGYMAGNVALLLWSSLGCFIVLLLVALVTGAGERRHIWLAALVFIFFSGLDFAGVCVKHVMGGGFNHAHLEWWAENMQFSANTTCLYWVYNQAIVPWMLVLCLVNETKIQNSALLGILAFPYGPFPFVGIVLLCCLNGLSGLRAAAREKRLAGFVREVFSPQNVLGLLAVAPAYLLYYTSNSMVSGENTGFRVLDLLRDICARRNLEELGRFAFVYVLFLALEVGVYVAVILRRRKPDIVFVGMVIALLLCPLFQIGIGLDFSMRVSIPSLVYLCVAFIQVLLREIPERGAWGGPAQILRRRKLLIAASVVFLIGAVTPLVEMRRELRLTMATPYSEIMDYHSDESLQSLPKDNFVAMDYRESAFYARLCRK